jgi:ribonuclease P protein component
MVLFAVRTEGESRFGVTASRKVGNAVIRARSKRRLRELYRLRRPTELTDALDLVANARRSCARAPWRVLVRDFEDCLNRLGEKMDAGRR